MVHSLTCDIPTMQTPSDDERDSELKEGDLVEVRWPRILANQRIQTAKFADKQ